PPTTCIYRGKAGRCWIDDCLHYRCKRSPGYSCPDESFPALEVFYPLHHRDFPPSECNPPAYHVRDRNWSYFGYLPDDLGVERASAERCKQLPGRRVPERFCV